MTHQRVAGSFRDPSGFVFTCDGTLYRQINQEYKQHLGILSYSARVVRDGEILCRWDHHLWQDIICLGD